MGQRLNRHFSREDIQMKNKYVKRCSRKTQIKTTVRFYYVPIRMAKIKSSNYTKYQWSGGTVVLILCWWEYFSLNLQNKVFFLLLFNIFVLIFWLYLVNLKSEKNIFRLDVYQCTCVDCFWLFPLELVDLYQLFLWHWTYLGSV